MLTKQEQLFFDRVALTMADRSDLTVEQAAKAVLDQDIAILNRYGRLSDMQQSEFKRAFVSRVYHAIRGTKHEAHHDT